ncbi:MAG: cysteine desulfurase family protein [Armatimonadota bacterium]|nr:cysteine desulfurase [Armatimonadota bacterium]MDW8156950.1 cysteine desulfurase family protein [Armatimonadota bacterium]
MRRVYLDHSATSPPLPEVVEAVRDALERFPGNPASLHGLGVEAEGLLERSREAVALSLGAEPSEVVFTSGGTEANNLAVFGAAWARQDPHVVVSAFEHSSVLEPARRLKESGVAVDFCPVDGEGFVRLDALEDLLRPNTALVSVVLVNNEVGTLQPVAEVARLLDRAQARWGRRPLLHTDAVQALGHVLFRVRDLGADLVTVSAHKLGGPKGVGALFVRRGVRLRPLVLGGDQERGLRAGTPNLPGIAGFAAAVRFWDREGDHLRDRLRQLSGRLRAGLQALGGLRWNTPSDVDRTAPHILNVSVPGLRGEVLVHRLEQEGVYASTGSACHSRRAHPSHVLLAMGRSKAEAVSAVRLSLGPETTEDDVDHAVAAFRAALEDLRFLVRS